VEGFTLEDFEVQEHKRLRKFNDTTILLLGLIMIGPVRRISLQAHLAAHIFEE